MVFLEISQNSLASTSARVSFLIKLQALLKQASLKVFSCESLKFSQSSYSLEKPSIAASDVS